MLLLLLLPSPLLSQLMLSSLKYQSCLFPFPVVPHATGSLQSCWSGLMLLSQSTDPSSQQQPQEQ